MWWLASLRGRDKPVELAIDTAHSEIVSVALSERGSLVAEMTWRCHRNQSRELLPTIDRLMLQMRVGKSELGAVFACTGPGGYTGLRVGLSVAKGLALALDLPLLGIGSLELSAYQQRAFPGPICAVHKAGRGELGWALYELAAGGWRELTEPRLTPPAVMLEQTPRGALFCGEIDPALEQALLGRSYLPGAAGLRRSAVLSELGWERLQLGYTEDIAAVRPIYLREAARLPGGR